MKRGLQLIRYLFYTVGVLIIAVNLFILLSGRYYLYNGISKTYLVGKTGPSIYDNDLFAVNNIKKSTHPFQWKTHPSSKNVNLPKDDMAYLDEVKTKALLIIRNDSILFENYWGGHTKETTSNSFSMAKTIVSLLVGIALNEGKIKSIHDPVHLYIPEFKENGRDVITIYHLLTMSAGFDWNESGKNPLAETAEAYYGSDLRRLVTRQRVITKPGTIFHYQSGNTQLLSMIVEAATGLTISDYAQEKLWEPIGSSYGASWSKDKEDGDEKAYCCFYATARDFALLGKLMLNLGNFEDKQIVPVEYIRKMVSPDTTMLTEDGITNLVYGLHIWTFYNNGNPVHYFRGLLGQYIFFIPKENTIIVRIGEHTEKNFKLHRIPLFPKKINSYDYLVGHSVDILEYLKIKDFVIQQIALNERRIKRP